MKSEQFNEIVNNRLELVKSILTNKAKEYANGDVDKLHSFKIAARMLNTTEAASLWGMAIKHFVSVSDMVENSKKGVYPSEDMINEKIGDAINYFILLEAVFKEQL